MTNSHPDADQELVQRTEDLFLARSVIEETTPRPVPLLFADIYRFLTDPSANLSPAQQRMLFANPRARADFQRLKRDLTQAVGSGAVGMALPTAAAASDRVLNERHFSGGVVRIAQSEASSIQFYIVVELNDPKDPPRALLLESSTGELAKLHLEAPDEDGIIQILLDVSAHEAERQLALLRDPTATGLFI